MGSSETTRARHLGWTRPSLWAGLLAPFLLAACVSAAGETRAVACGPAPPLTYADPLARPGLSVLSCPLPQAGSRLLIVTDPSISWPVLIEDGAATSFEGQVQDASLPGLPFFDPAADRVLWQTDPSPLILISLTTSEPSTNAPIRLWLALDPQTAALRRVASPLQG